MSEPRMPRDQKRVQIQVVRPGLTTDITYTGTHGVLTAVVTSKVVRVVCSSDAYILFGSAPVATSNAMPVKADQAEYFRAEDGIDKISAIQVSANGTLTVTMML